MTPYEKLGFDELWAIYEKLPAASKAGWMVEHRDVLRRKHREKEQREAEELQRKLDVEAKKRERELAREAKQKRESQLPDAPNSPPVEWVLDGSYATLTASAQRILLVVYAMLDPKGMASRIQLEDIARLSGCSLRTCSRGVTELLGEGWIRRSEKRVGKRGGGTKCWYALPPPGRRRVTGRP